MSLYQFNICQKACILIFFLGFRVLYSQEEIFEPNHNFTENQIVYLYGDNVKLRTAPNTQSEVIDLLKIGTQITILEKTDQSQKYNGLDSPWYKIKYKSTTGYILGGLIAIHKTSFNNSTYLIAVKVQGERFYLQTRLLENSKTYIENETEFFNTHFSIKSYDNKGLESIKNMLLIEYMPIDPFANNGGFIYLIQVQS
ncbi:SH3 domain-containing protein [Aquimarina algicola]|uniref:SH3 domain-containing protein n=1 Tax=Aquimarina algicola TaxID=2589995 RepID=A0A504J132_9FLAO|nr:SH3 domain-containing protein [Aquimarina algicola]TPN82152.1 SH3 domain-containing protein [Aquimarina algicola]